MQSVPIILSILPAKWDFTRCQKIHSLQAHRLIYLSIFIPVLAYRCDILDITRNPNNMIIKRFWKKIRDLLCRTNEDQLSDLHLGTISEVVKNNAINYVKRLHNYHVIAFSLLDNSNGTKWFKRIHVKFIK